MKTSIAGALALLLASPVLAQNPSWQADLSYTKQADAQQGWQMNWQASAARQQGVNVRLTFHLIEADSFQGDDPEIRPVVTELRKLFRFQGYRLASKSVLTATAKPSSGVSQRVTDPEGFGYVIQASVDGDETSVRLSVTLSSEGPGLGYRTADGVVVGGSRILIDASVNLTDGKTVVLGSAQASKDSRALILVVTPTINP
jgi:hypothetical protein